MVRAFAGDSTMTRIFDMQGSGALPCSWEGEVPGAGYRTRRSGKSSRELRRPSQTPAWNRPRDKVAAQVFAPNRTVDLMQIREIPVPGYERVAEARDPQTGL